MEILTHFKSKHFKQTKTLPLPTSLLVEKIEETAILVHASLGKWPCAELSAGLRKLLEAQDCAMRTEPDHVTHLLQTPWDTWFKFDHLPEGLMRNTSSMVHNAYYEAKTTTAESAEKTTMLRKLLESKDCFVRAAMHYQACQKAEAAAAAEPDQPAAAVMPERKGEGYEDGEFDAVAAGYFITWTQPNGVKVSYPFNGGLRGFVHGKVTVRGGNFAGFVGPGLSVAGRS